MSQHTNDIKVHYRLLEERKRLNLKQMDVATFLNMSSKQIGRWESKIAIPTDKLIELAEIGFDIQYVLMGKPADLTFIQSSNTITIDQAVQVAAFASKEAIKTVFKVREMQNKLVSGVKLDALENLTLIVKATEILARCKITGDISSETFEKILDLTIPNS